jgi:hypothetical protein
VCDDAILEGVELLELVVVRGGEISPEESNRMNRIESFESNRIIRIESNRIESNQIAYDRLSVNNSFSSLAASYGTAGP